MIISAKDLKNFIICVAIPLIIGFLSNSISNLIAGSTNSGAYTELLKPGFFPPAIVFPIVWTILYTLMGVSAYLINKKGNNSIKVRDALFYYWLQLALNFLWSILFFGLKLRFTALVDLGLLIVVVIIMIIKFTKVDKLAAYINFPYLAWLFYAFFLNYVTWSINK